jgi:murein DD-endopeptidase MepM/ murein hydrolase activator NlpD
MLSPIVLLGALVLVGGVRTDPPEPRVGDLAILYIENTDAAVERAPVKIFGYEFVAFRVAKDKLRAVIAVPIDINGDDYPVQIIYPQRTDIAKVTIVDREFDRSELKVSNQFTARKSKELLARLRREERELRALFRPEPGPPLFGGPMSRPVTGIVTANFGTKRVFNGKLASTHYGLDLDAKTGDPIRSAAAGRVVMSSLRWASGGTVIVDHGGGFFTAYFHMSKRNKNVGDWVSAGDVLGLAGMTGRVTGPHARLSKIPRSFFVDPVRVLDLVFDADPAYILGPKAKEPSPSSEPVVVHTYSTTSTETAGVP